MGSEKLNQATILLVEGITEEKLYIKLLEKLYNTKRIKFTELPPPIKSLLEPLEKRTTNMIIEENSREKYLALIQCGGYENIKGMLRMLLKRRELVEALKQTRFNIIVAADLDKDPIKSIKDTVASLHLPVEARNNHIAVKVQGQNLNIRIIQQGYKKPGATGQIEDNLEGLLKTLYPELIEAIKVIEETTKEKLDSKQKLLIYLALLEQKPKIRNLYETIGKHLEKANINQLHSLGNIVQELTTYIDM